MKRMETLISTLLGLINFAAQMESITNSPSYFSDHCIISRLKFRDHKKR